MSPIKTIELTLNAYTFSLEIDTEDPENLVIESVTAIGGPIKSDTDIDPDEFEDEWMGDDGWIRIKEALNK